MAQAFSINEINGELSRQRRAISRERGDGRNLTRMIKGELINKRIYTLRSLFQTKGFRAELALVLASSRDEDFSEVSESLNDWKVYLDEMAEVIENLDSQVLLKLYSKQVDKRLDGDKFKFVDIAIGKHLNPNLDLKSDEGKIAQILDDIKNGIEKVYTSLESKLEEEMTGVTDNRSESEIATAKKYTMQLRRKDFGMNEEPDFSDFLAQLEDMGVTSSSFESGSNAAPADLHDLGKNPDRPNKQEELTDDEDGEDPFGLFGKTG